MKKITAFLVALLMSSCLFADIKWYTRKEIDDKLKDCFSSSASIQAAADCDTEEEALKITRVSSFDPYFENYGTLENPSELNSYLIIFFQGEDDRNYWAMAKYTEGQIVVEIFYGILKSF